jgi:hypothetical protein
MPMPDDELPAASVIATNSTGLHYSREYGLALVRRDGEVRIVSTRDITPDETPIGVIWPGAGELGQLEQGLLSFSDLLAVAILFGTGPLDFPTAHKIAEDSDGLRFRSDCGFALVWDADLGVRIVLTRDAGSYPLTLATEFREIGEDGKFFENERLPLGELQELASSLRGRALQKFSDHP